MATLLTGKRRFGAGYGIAPVFPSSRWSRADVGANSTDLTGLGNAFNALSQRDQTGEQDIVTSVSDADLQGALLTMRALGTYGLMPRPTGGGGGPTKIYAPIMGSYNGFGGGQITRSATYLGLSQLPVNQTYLNPTQGWLNGMWSSFFPQQISSAGQWGIKAAPYRMITMPMLVGSDFDPGSGATGQSTSPQAPTDTTGHITGTLTATGVFTLAYNGHNTGTITGATISGTVVTITCPGTWVAGQKVLVAGLANGSGTNWTNANGNQTIITGGTGSFTYNQGSGTPTGTSNNSGTVTHQVLNASSTTTQVGAAIDACISLASAPSGSNTGTTATGTLGTTMNVINAANYQGGGSLITVNSGSATYATTATTMTLADVAAGVWDTLFTKSFQALANNGCADAIIRLGWESYGSWYQWGGPANRVGYIAAWQHLYTLAKTISPNFKFDWNGAGYASGYILGTNDNYPGDAYVDFISADIYDYTPTNAGPWGLTGWNGTGPNSLATGLTPGYNFAQAHGKPFCIPEYGCWPSGLHSGSYGGGDDPTWMTALTNWMLTTPGIGYAMLFDNGTMFNTYPNACAGVCAAAIDSVAAGNLAAGV